MSSRRERGVIWMALSRLKSRRVSPTTPRARSPRPSDSSPRSNRANVMIKIPATKAGLPAIRAVLGAGINVNVTLIFSVERYGEVITAWRDGIADAVRATDTRPARSRAWRRSSSLASTLRSTHCCPRVILVGAPRPTLRRPRPTSSTASASRLLTSPTCSTWGAQVQRPLWASTSTKNPSYPDLLYVDRLVAHETVNTMPDKTLADVLDHGDFSSSYLLNDDSTHQRQPHSWTISPRTSTSPK